jgi:F-type H+-transporting ATPase subunit epsilon
MLKLSIVTPEKRILTDAEVEDLIIPTYGGEINVLEGHTALMTTLTPGTLSYTVKGSASDKVIVSWGYCEVAENKVNILAETAEKPSEIDPKRAEEALKKSEQALSAADLDPAQIEKLQWKKERAMVRIAATKIPH